MIKQRTKFVRLLAEGAVIVVSVLLALSADAWWEGQQAKARAENHLRSLLRDVEQMETRLDSSMVAAQKSNSSAFEILSSLREGPPFIEADLFILHVFGTLYFEDFSPSTGSYQALNSTGDTELIQNDELKRELSNFFGSFDDLRVTEQGRYDFLSDFLRSDAFVQNIGMQSLPELGLQNVSGVNESVVARLMADREFAHYISVLAVANQLTLEDYAFMSESLARINLLLREEIGE